MILHSRKDPQEFLRKSIEERGGRGVGIRNKKAHNEDG